MSEPTSETDQSSSSKRPRVGKEDHGTKCLCCDPRCDLTHEKLKKYKPDRYAYFDLPSQPKPSAELKKQPSAAAEVQRTRKAKRRKRILKALGTDATTRANDVRYSKTSNRSISTMKYSLYARGMTKISCRLLTRFQKR